MRRTFISFNILLCLLTPASTLLGQKPVFPEKDPAIAGAHIGISIYDPASGEYVYELNADKYFIPASTLKIFSLYAGLKYLGDSLPGIRIIECKDRLWIEGTADPTLLHPLFNNPGILNYLANSEKKILIADNDVFRTEAYGPGWSWEDYEESFMPERSSIPLYGNLVHLSFKNKITSLMPEAGMALTLADQKTKRDFSRKQHSNDFTAGFQIRKDTQWTIPFITSKQLTAQLLEDTLHKKVELKQMLDAETGDCRSFFIRSMPPDSILSHMMHESDNFLAEQTLLMVSYLRYGFMDEKKLIEEILKLDLADIPQKPRWVDGSGLSRYNLVSPRDQVYLLDKLQKEFGDKRLRSILPAGGRGTLKSSYLSADPYIFAKTGTISNNNGLCGYLITRQGKTLIFSVLLNNYPGKSAPVRRIVEDFLKDIRRTN